MNLLDLLLRKRGLTGVLEIEVRDSNGQITKRQINNLVVDNAALQLVHALTAAPAGYKIDHMVLGDSVTDPAVTDLNVGNPLLSVEISQYEDVADHGLKCTAVLAADEGVGQTFKEIGLFMANNQMISRIGTAVFGSHTKEDNTTWTFNWTITLTPP